MINNRNNVNRLLHFANEPTALSSSFVLSLNLPLYFPDREECLTRVYSNFQSHEQLSRIMYIRLDENKTETSQLHCQIRMKMYPTQSLDSVIYSNHREINAHQTVFTKLYF